MSSKKPTGPREPSANNSQTNAPKTEAVSNNAPSASGHPIVKPQAQPAGFQKGPIRTQSAPAVSDPPRGSFSTHSMAFVPAGFTPAAPFYYPYGQPHMPGPQMQHISTPMSQPAPTAKRPTQKLAIIDPKTKKNILEEDSGNEPSQQNGAAAPAKPEEKGPSVSTAKEVVSTNVVAPDVTEVPATATTTTASENKDEEPTDIKIDNQLATSEASSEATTPAGGRSMSENEDDAEDMEEDEEDEEDEDDEEEADAEDGESRKLTYSRDFLLKFKEHCLNPPDTLKNLPVFIDPLNRSPSALSAVQQRGGKAPRGTRGMNFPSTGRGGRGGREVNAFKSKNFPKNRSGPSTPVEGLLKPGANAWVPKKPVTEIEQVTKQVKGILNKITPETFDRLKEKLLAIPIPDEETLKIIIVEVYEKAVREPGFSKLYADLCSDVSKSDKGSLADSKKSFRRILLNKCQEEFEKKPDFEKLKDLEQEQRDEEEFKIRKRMVGNIKFIGELFKQKMLHEKVMHEVIRTLLFEAGKSKVPEPYEIENLCQLMKTIGSLLDNNKFANEMNLYFARMTELSNHDALQTRLKFMLKDTIDLRKNKWKPRREELQAKTIEEVHKQAEEEAKAKEAASKAAAAQSHMKRFSQTRQQPTPTKKGPAAAEAWTSVQGKPGRNVGGGRGGGYSSAAPPQSGGRGYGRHGGHTTKGAGSTAPKQEVARPPNFGNESDLQLRPQSASTSEAAAGKAPAEASKPEAPKKSKFAKMSADEIAEKIWDDFVNEEDKEGVVDDLKALSTADASLSNFVHKCFLSAADGSKLTKFSKLITYLRQQDVLSSAGLIGGMTAALADAISVELWTDIPKIFLLYGETLAFFVADDVLALEDVQRIICDVRDNPDYTGVVHRKIYRSIAEIIAVLKEEKGNDFERFFTSTTFNTFVFFDPAERDDFEDICKDFREENPEDASVFIYKAIKSRQPYDTILTWLSERVEKEVRESVEFTAKVTCAVLTAIELEGTFADSQPDIEKEKELLDSYVNVLKVYAGHGVEYQRRVLDEIQYFAFRAGFPEGMLERLFKHLYDNEIVIEDVFNQWRKAPNKSIPEHNRAAEQLAGWFEWLAKAREQNAD